MIEERKCLFSKEQLDNVSNIIEDNLSILLKNEEYCKLENCISDLHERICSKIKNTELENIFENYNNNIIDHKIYELALVYNVGILAGIELSDIKKEVVTNSEKYLSKKIIDFSKYLNQKQVKFLEEFKVFIDNRLYTIEELKKINREVFFYSNSSIYSQKSINEILEIFTKISNDYEIK